jgi:hypothetical protein
MRIAAVALFVVGIVALAVGLVDQRWHQRSTSLIPMFHNSQRQAGHVDTFTTPFMMVIGGGAIAGGFALLLFDSTKRRP